jgi:tRNA(Arg) A34 adenosine deaminase TadA
VTVTETDLGHLRRCVELARAGFEGGDEPFGSVLVDAAGVERFADHNRVSGGDETRHPEFEAAKWAANNLTPEERAAATVYTSTEHCPMCAAAHGWVGLGRIVVATSSAQVSAWRAEWGAAPSPLKPLGAADVIKDPVLDGPVPELADEVRSLHRQDFLRKNPGRDVENA